MGSQYTKGSIVDKVTQAQTGIDYEHHKIHAGSHYVVAGFTTLASEGTADFGFLTPATGKQAHVVFNISAQSETEFYVYSNAIYSSGTPVTPVNNNRSSSNTSSMTLVSDPTIASTGTSIFSVSKGAAGVGFFGSDSGGLTTRDREIVLDYGTSYLFRIKSRDDSNTVSYEGEWYEHTSKDV